MERKIVYQITEAEEGQKIGVFLQNRGYSGQNLIALKKMPESILIDGRWEYVNYKMHAGETMEVHIQETASSEKIEPEDLPLDIVYEDEDILVVNKDADTPVHPSLNHYHGTLANAVAYYYQQQGKEFVFRCVNRLDRDTTGLVILAKHMLSSAILGNAMKKREIKRQYVAIVAGEDIDDEGTIDLPIDRKDGSVIERVVSPEGQRAVTYYKVLQRKNGLSLITLRLETGRTHQIRVHMKAIGHPLIGDDLYAPEYMLMDRQALHSGALTFPHPITGEEMHFEQEIPEDMKNYFHLS